MTHRATLGARIAQGMSASLLVAGLSGAAWALDGLPVESTGRAVQMHSTELALGRFDNPAQEAQYRGLIAEFRCPKCQNQSLAGSDAPIAQDLKQRVHDMVMDSRTDDQVRQYMIDRYGDFITYRPPISRSTVLLWAGPPVLLLLVVLGWLSYFLRRGAHDQQPLSEDEKAQIQRLRQLNATTPSAYPPAAPPAVSDVQGPSKP